MVDIALFDYEWVGGKLPNSLTKSYENVFHYLLVGVIIVTER